MRVRFLLLSLDYPYPNPLFPLVVLGDIVYYGSPLAVT